MAAFNKPASLPLPDLNRPAFCVPKLRKLVGARKCPTCQKDICDDDFKTDLDRKEYSISGMCFKCQADMFAPAPKVDDKLDCVALMRGLHRIQERGGTAQDEERFLRLAGFCEDPKQAKNTNADEKGLGCDDCYPCVSGGSHPCANEPEKHCCAIGECMPLKKMDAANDACAECLKSIMENSVMVGEVSRGRNQWDTGYIYSCSFHGQNVECVEDRNDKRETWKCRECGAEDEFRVWYAHDCM